MDKFLSIPVTGEGYHLVPCGDLKLVEAASATSTTLSYGSGKVITITHATVGAASGSNSGTQLYFIELNGITLYHIEPPCITFKHLESY